MYNFQRYQSKELALAYMSGKRHDLSPEEFLQQLKTVDTSFQALLKNGQSNANLTMVKAF
ncbi:hypothetical protein PCO86_16430 [Pectobacteriaceae bacterium CE70]|uniref:Uncharacterized protein n=1 Tax=Serratia sp. (strain ATCC 39006) TaxID=104623 RepID=A0A2I5T5R9_SERS3|nr:MULTISPECIES: hypothetical protein [Enterobacterales]WJV57221.1 hypothetical protein PCO84_16855 [Pectobacteriaceae bacterium C111]WJV61595.1 hypothetical protein PCO87_17145 [Pectobacteriaceae bacterium C52]WJV65870.1 hypothetical protein PCO86_16430 [Pectobacteriaceae bacterium CE70]WJY09889.1 hypothetical protein PCO80_16370 [Pectobacteriaceae bacterium C80]WJY16099.1 hypothetical protein PCO82_05350 [Pectobacteriaceae bacterium CE90]